MKQFTYKHGIAERIKPESTELTKYQEKAEKGDKVMALRLERAKLKERLHQIGQEEAKLFGTKEKYRGKEE